MTSINSSIESPPDEVKYLYFDQDQPVSKLWDTWQSTIPKKDELKASNAKSLSKSIDMRNILQSYNFICLFITLIVPLILCASKSDEADAYSFSDSLLDIYLFVNVSTCVFVFCYSKLKSVISLFVSSLPVLIYSIIKFTMYNELNESSYHKERLTLILLFIFGYSPMLFSLCFACYSTFSKAYDNGVNKSMYEFIGNANTNDNNTLNKPIMVKQDSTNSYSSNDYRISLKDVHTIQGSVNTVVNPINQEKYLDGTDDDSKLDPDELDTLENGQNALLESVAAEEEKEVKPKLQHSSMNRLFSLAKPERWLLFYGSIALFISSTAQLAQPLYFGMLY